MGYIDEAGRLVIPATFDSAEPFVDGRARVRKDGAWGYIDESGRRVWWSSESKAPASQ